VHNVVAGIGYRPTDFMGFNLDLGHTRSDAGMTPFDFYDAAFFADHGDALISMGRTHSYSDLDVEYNTVHFGFRYDFTPDVWLLADYDYADYSDDDPYLHDTSGRVHYYTLAVGIRF